MKLQPLERTDGFVVIDLDAATTSVGVVRTAPKVLREGAELLARSVTYAYAVFGVAGHAGASAAVNAPPDEREQRVATMVDELRPQVTEHRLVLHPGTGITDADLAAWGQPPLDPSLTAAGALACTEVLLGGLAGRRVALAGTGPVVDAARTLIEARGAEAEAGDLGTAADALLVAGKAGVLDDEAAEKVAAGVVVPLTAVAVTARAFAVLRRGGVTVVPDFVSTAAPLLDLAGGGTGDVVDRVHAVSTELAPEGLDMWFTAVGLAEANLGSWQDEKPFGRPLA